MKNKKIKSIVVMTIAVFVFAYTLPAVAEEMAQTMPPGMDEEMMAKMKEFSTPGENHQVLDYFVGDWAYTAKFWMSPDAPPEESAGTSSTQWIMDGRFIEQAFVGAFMGSPFNGKMTMGFDNLKKMYVSTWIDDMSTGIMTSEATYDAASQSFTEHGSHSCPIDGTRHFRAIIKIIDKNTYSYITTIIGKDGSETPGMEILYTRNASNSQTL